jgi:hypothetical protein
MMDTRNSNFSLRYGIQDDYGRSQPFVLGESPHEHGKAETGDPVNPQARKQEKGTRGQ